MTLFSPFFYMLLYVFIIDQPKKVESDRALCIEKKFFCHWYRHMATMCGHHTRTVAYFFFFGGSFFPFCSFATRRCQSTLVVFFLWPFPFLWCDHWKGKGAL
nr:hypothetical protein [Pandoravirus massiliensis]